MNLHTTPELARHHRDHLLAAAAEERLARQVRPARRPVLARLLGRRRPATAPVAPVAPVTPVTRKTSTPAAAGRTRSAA
jgi:hypothetical protein